MHPLIKFTTRIQLLSWISANRVTMVIYLQIHIILLLSILGISVSFRLGSNTMYRYAHLKMTNVEVMTTEQVSTRLCRLLCNKAQTCIESKGSFNFAIPGGSILKMLGAGQAAGAFDGVDWSKCSMGWVNHRAVPLDDPTSTEFKANPLFLDAWKKGGLNVYSLGGSTDAVAEASSMAGKISAVTKWDMQLVGVGLDGHIGSLYPHSEAVAVTGRGILSVVKPASSSISMTMEEILSTDEIIVACCGKSEKYPLGKAEGMQRALEADETKDSFPAAALRDCALWLLDEGAASLLTK